MACIVKLSEPFDINGVILEMVGLAMLSELRCARDGDELVLGPGW